MSNMKIANYTSMSLYARVYTHTGFIIVHGICIWSCTQKMHSHTSMHILYRCKYTFAWICRCTFTNAHPPLHTLCWLSHSHQNMTLWWWHLALFTSLTCVQVWTCPQYFHRNATSNVKIMTSSQCEFHIWSCFCRIVGDFLHKYDRALRIVNRLSIPHSGSASLRKVWAGTRRTLQVSSGSASTLQVSSGSTSPLQASSGAGSTLLQPRHLYAQSGSLCYCLQVEGGFEI